MGKNIRMTSIIVSTIIVGVVVNKLFGFGGVGVGVGLTAYVYEFYVLPDHKA